MPTAYLPRCYGPGASIVDILGDLIVVLGASVDRSQLHTSIVSALSARGIVPDLVTKTGFNAGNRPLLSQITAIMDALGVRWSIQDHRFVTE